MSLLVLAVRLFLDEMRFEQEIDFAFQRRSFVVALVDRASQPDELLAKVLLALAGGTSSARSGRRDVAAVTEPS